MTHEQFEEELKALRADLTPESFSYDEKHVFINNQVVGINRYELPNPRYGFLQGLNLFPELETDRMYFTDHKLINYNTHIHDPVAIGPHSVIGGTGFGYVEHNGILHRMPHYGNVILGKHVRIGANVCIDRAVLGSTIIGGGTKIDNLVHIAHGAKIGRNCLIAAGAVIGGSAEIGDRVKIWIGAKIANKVKIGDNAVIGAGAVVRHHVGPGETWIGNPAKLKP